ncbi:MAG: hypothetical protein VB089_18105 [Anaerolineaceae bacterium]|nr:hypothetical protein [Anaerolineaceae bacterium]
MKFTRVLAPEGAGLLGYVRWPACTVYIQEGCLPVGGCIFWIAVPHLGRSLLRTLAGRRQAGRESGALKKAFCGRYGRFHPASGGFHISW